MVFRNMEAIRIGTAGKPRVTDLACGREVTLVR